MIDACLVPTGTRASRWSRGELLFRSRVRAPSTRVSVICAPGQPHIVFDWKSDVDPDAASRADYANQLRQYVHVLGADRDVLGADRGAVVYMTSGRVEWINKAR
jgi:hypothetical protein